MKAEHPVHTNIDMSFTDPSAEESFDSIDIEIDTVSDYKKKMGEYKVSAGTYGIDMSIGNIVAADNTLYISVPILFKDKIYSLDTVSYKPLTLTTNRIVLSSVDAALLHNINCSACILCVCLS